MRVIFIMALSLILSTNPTKAINPLETESATLSCIYSLKKERQIRFNSASLKQSKLFFNTAWNETAVQNSLSKSPSCLVHSIKPEEDTLRWLSNLQRHLIVVEGVNCGGLLPSHFNVHLYCVEGDMVYEKYQIRTQSVFRKVGTISTGFPLSIYNEKLVCRSDLMGVELTVTTLDVGRTIEGSVYGPPEQSRVGGVFGDLFMIMKNRLNFTFTLHKPKDNKWGGKEDGRKLGWNGMIGDIAEGIADFGIGPFTSTPQRNEVVKFSVGNLDVGKTFFVKRTSKNVINLMIFIKPFKTSTWAAVISLILVVGLVLFFIVHFVKDKQVLEFNIRKSLTFSFSGITFVRRWSVTPISVSARIVFRSVLYIGIIVQGMWKASFTSVLAVQKELVLYNNLEDLLKTGFTISVEGSSAQEGNFRYLS